LTENVDFGGVSAWREIFFKKTKESSFSEEKEAEKRLILCGASGELAVSQTIGAVVLVSGWKPRHPPV
jgi:hypothetical protein